MRGVLGLSYPRSAVSVFRLAQLASRSGIRHDKHGNEPTLLIPGPAPLRRSRRICLCMQFEAAGIRLSGVVRE